MEERPQLIRACQADIAQQRQDRSAGLNEKVRGRAASIVEFDVQVGYYLNLKRVRRVGKLLLVVLLLVVGNVDTVGVRRFCVRFRRCREFVASFFVGGCVVDRARRARFSPSLTSRPEFRTGGYSDGDTAAPGGRGGWAAMEYGSGGR